MSADAKITVLSGPDRGRVYELTGEMVRLGRSPENDLVLSDAQLGEHHASIVFREGRYAICAAAAAALEIDGTEVPPDRWVWLPEAARIRFGQSTSVEFAVNGNRPVAATANAEAASGNHSSALAEAHARAPGGSATGSSGFAGKRSGTGSKSRRSGETAVPGSDSTSRPGSDAPTRSRKTGERGQKTRTVARFITDGPGDPLVKLGEDGHLPELLLKEAQSGARQETAGQKQSNPLVLILALAFSFGATLLLLVMDTGSFGDHAAEKAKARAAVEEFYSPKGGALQPYQEHLRRARLAHTSRDFATERNEYREVLALLRSEANEKIYKYTGLTGSTENDLKLEKLIGTLLSE